MIALMIGPAHPAAAVELVTFPSGTTAELPPAPTATITFPVERSQDVDHDPVASVVRLRRGGVEFPLGAVEPAVTAAFDPGTPAVVLRVGEDKLQSTGTYDVLVALTVEPLRQHVTFTLTRPPTELTLASTVRVDRTVWFPDAPWDLDIGPIDVGDVTTEAPRLVVTTSEDGRLSRLRYRQVEAESGRITIPDRERPVAPDSTVRIPYVPQGDFPLGTVSRTVQLRAPELAAPVTVRFEVRTRRHHLLIPILVAFGVLLGLLVRVLIPAVLGATRARRRGIELTGKLQALREEHEDEAFQDEIGDLVQRLSQLPWGTSRANSEIEAARSQAEEALTHLRENLVQQSDRLRAFAGVLLRDWRLPATLRDQLREARDLVELADIHLDRSNATAGQTSLDALAAKFRNDLEPQAAQWADEYRHGLEQVRDAAGVSRTAGALGVLNHTASVSLSLLPAGDLDGAEGDRDEDEFVEAVSDALLRVHIGLGTYRSVRETLERVANEAEQVAEALDPLPLAARQLEKLRTAIDELRATVDGQSDPTETLPAAAGAISALVTSEEAAIRAPLADAKLPDVEQRLTAGDLRGATAGVIARQPLEQQMAVETRLGGPPATRLGGAQAAAVPAAVTDVAVTAAVAEPAPLALTWRQPGLATQVRLAPARLALGAVSLSALLLQAVLVLLLVLVVAYPLFSTDWTGTFADIAMVLTWAFAVDLTVEGVRRLTGQGATPGPIAS